MLVFMNILCRQQVGVGCELGVTFTIQLLCVGGAFSFHMLSS